MISLFVYETQVFNNDQIKKKNIKGLTIASEPVKVLCFWESSPLKLLLPASSQSSTIN